MRFHRLRTPASAHAAVFTLGALALAACSGGATGPGAEDDVRVNLFARSGAASAAVAPASGGAGAASAVQSIEIDGLTVVLGGVKLETAGVDETVDWVDESSRIVELAVDGGFTMGAAYVVTPGTYKELEVSIDKLEPGNPAEDPLVAEHPALSNASVLASGTVVRDDGSSAPFTFATDLDRDLEIDLSPFLEVVAGSDTSPPTTVVSVVIDVGVWFDDGAGGILDPTDDAHRSAIESNASASVVAFLDGDEDGEPGP